MNPEIQDIKIEEIKETHWIIKSMNPQDKKKDYDVWKRKDGSYFCTCSAFYYNTSKCKHITAIQEMKEFKRKSLEIKERMQKNNDLSSVQDYKIIDGGK